MTIAQVVERYGLKPALVSHILSENPAKAKRDCRKAIPVHFARRNDLGPQGRVARKASRSLVSHLRLLNAAGSR